jgi:protein arginine N-methyltransferase 1
MNEEDPWSNVDDAFLSKPAAPQKPESEAEPVAKPTK